MTPDVTEGAAPRTRPTPLPPLREDLILHEGPTGTDGSPTWVLEDPARDRFFQLGYVEGELLKRWSLGTAQAVAEALKKETILTVSDKKIEEFQKFLLRMSLTREAGLSRRLAEERKRRPQTTVWQFLLHHYLFFRIPLVRPDRFLKRTLPWIESTVMTAGFLKATLLAALLAFYLIGRQWDAFLHTFQHFYSWQGALFAGAALILTKTIHELGHAYTAEHYGCRVPTMGVAFMVMMPLLYTDTTAAWRLKKRRERLAVCAAGVGAELSLAVWASLAWSFLPDGYLRSAAFLLATTAWVMSVAVNMMPFMRFDGYYFLSDLLSIANLHQRSFAIARHHLRRILFGFEDLKPEAFAPAMEKVLVIYAWSTWLYRFFLFTGIALLVYHAFFKVLGIFLFCVEVSVFVMLPILKEVKVWFDGVKAGKARPRAWCFFALLSALAVGLFWPWSGHVETPAILKFAEEQTLYVPTGARIRTIHARLGQALKKGDVIYELESPQLTQEREKLKAALDLAQWRMHFLRMNRETAADVPVADKERSALVRRLSDVERELQALTLTAASDGILADAPADVSEGEWVSTGEWLGLVTTVKPEADGERVIGVEAWAYVSETDLARLSDGIAAAFVPEDNTRKTVLLKLASVDRTAARHLGAAPELASPFGGPVAAVAASAAAARSFGVDNGTVYAPQEAVYRLVFKGSLPYETVASEAGLLNASLVRGHVVWNGERSSFAGRFLRFAWSVILRESGF